MDKSKKLILTLTFSLSLCLLAFLVYQQVTIGNQAKTNQTILENEFGSINQLPSAKEVQHFSRLKPDQVTVNSTFNTYSSFEVIRDYYIDEVPKHGWIFKDSKSLLVWGKDLGGQELTFEKSQYMLHIDYPGNDPAFNYTYGMVVSWR